MANYTRLFDNDAIVRKLAVTSNYVLSSRLPEIGHDDDAKNGPLLLSSVISLIFTQHHDSMMNNLDWRRVSDASNRPQAGCYDAISSDREHLYSVNLLTGETKQAASRSMMKEEEILEFGFY